MTSPFSFRQFVNYERLGALLYSLANAPAADEIEKLAEDLLETIKSGNRLIVFGNGGKRCGGISFCS